MPGSVSDLMVTSIPLQADYPYLLPQLSMAPQMLKVGVVGHRKTCEQV